MSKKDRKCVVCGAPCFGKTCAKCFQSKKVGLSKLMNLRRQNRRRKERENENLS